MANNWVQINLFMIYYQYMFASTYLYTLGYIKFSQVESGHEWEKLKYPGL